MAGSLLHSHRYNPNKPTSFFNPVDERGAQAYMLNVFIDSEPPWLQKTKNKGENFFSRGG
jgi:hypothetical protein